MTSFTLQNWFVQMIEKIFWVCDKKKYRSKWYCEAGDVFLEPGNKTSLLTMHNVMLLLLLFCCCCCWSLLFSCLSSYAKSLIIIILTIIIIILTKITIRTGTTRPAWWRCSCWERGLHSQVCFPQNHNQHQIVQALTLAITMLIKIWIC